MARNFGTDVSPFTNAASITEVGNNVIRIDYSWKNATQTEHHKPGTVFALCGNAHRETAGAFTWESKNVLAEGVAEGTPYFLWSFPGGTAVTRTPEFTVTTEGRLACAVFPVDALGPTALPLRLLWIPSPVRLIWR